MKHLFCDSEGETYAADTVEQAREHVVELCGPDVNVDPVEQWSQIPDDKLVTIVSDDSFGPTKETKTAREWAAECDNPVQVSSTYC